MLSLFFYFKIDYNKKFFALVGCKSDKEKTFGQESMALRQKITGYHRITVTLSLKDWERIETVLERDARNRKNNRSKVVKKNLRESGDRVIDPEPIRYNIEPVKIEELTDHERKLYHLPAKQPSLSSSSGEGETEKTASTSSTPEETSVLQQEPLTIGLDHPVIDTRTTVV